MVYHGGNYHGTVDKHNKGYKGGLTTIFLNILKVIPPIIVGVNG